MRDLKLQLQTQDNSQTYEVTLNATDVQIVKSIKDVRKPESVKSNYTKQFEIPATKESNKFFEGLIYNGYFPTNFNPNFKVNAQLLLDDAVLIDGYLKLEEVNKEENDLNSYSVTLFGESALFFNTIAGLNLSDLDLSEYDHVWDYNNIVKSWDTSIKKDNIDIPFYKGRGYVYPIQHRGNLNNDFEVEDFMPSIYLKTLVDKIFQNAGVKYKSDFFNSEDFRSLVLDYQNDKIPLTDEEVAESEFKAQRGSDLDLFVPLTGNSVEYKRLETFPVEIADPNNVWDGTSFTSSKRQKINFRVDFKHKVKFAFSGNFKIANDELKLKYTLWDGTTQSVVTTATHDLSVDVNPTTNYTNEHIIEHDDTLSFDGILEQGHVYRVYTDLITNMRLWDGYDPIWPKKNFVTGFIHLITEADSTVLTANIDPVLYSGGDMKLNNILPKVSVKSFLTSLNKKFNLYWATDDNGDFRIEPRDDIYYKGDVNTYDWTNNVDRSANINIKPLSELNKAQYLFTEKSAKDYFNELHEDNEKEIYGEKKIDIGNDFLSGTEKIETIFNPAPLTMLNDGDIICNSYVALNSNTWEAYNGNLTVSYYGGMLSTDDGWTFKDNGVDYAFTTYPYAGHYDNPDNPAFDLNFGKTKKYYYNWENTTSANAYENYWKNYVNDVIAIDSHLLTTQLNLPFYDFLKFRLFDTIQIDEVHYAVNRIEYDLNTEIAKTELLKISSQVSKVQATSTKSTKFKGNEENNTYQGWEGPFVFKTTNKNYNTPIGVGSDFNKWTFLSDENWNTKGNYNLYSGATKSSSYGASVNSSQENNNVFTKGKGISVTGKNNYVAPKAIGITISGDTNQVSTNVKNVTITGNSNFIEAGVENTIVIGEGNYVTESNATYINGALVTSSGIKKKFNLMSGGIDEVQDPFNSSVYPNLIKGAVDSVQNIGGNSDVNFVSGDETTNIF